MTQQKPISPASRAIVRPLEHPDFPSGGIGVLLINLGTPDGTDYRSMRRYLKEFLSDRRVIEVPRPIWWPILNLIILSVRPSRSGANYRKIWNKEQDESPFRTITRSQAERLADRFVADQRIKVDWAMRYGTPAIGDRLQALLDAGCDRVLLVPLYPQYSAATTATAIDKVSAQMKKMRWQPSLRTLPPYYDDAAYVEALAQSLEAGIAGLDFEPEIVLASYHGMPRATLGKGDPYYCQCMKTTRLLGERLGWGEERLTTTFQSRFGNAEWLQPYTIDTVTELARSGVKRLAVITPGFAADCLETLEEIAVENAKAFKDAGGERFALIPCLNDSDPGMRMLETLVRNELKGWL